MNLTAQKVYTNTYKYWIYCILYTNTNTYKYITCLREQLLLHPYSNFRAFSSIKPWCSKDFPLPSSWLYWFFFQVISFRPMLQLEYFQGYLLSFIVIVRNRTTSILFWFLYSPCYHPINICFPSEHLSQNMAPLKVLVYITRSRLPLRSSLEYPCTTLRNLISTLH